MRVERAETLGFCPGVRKAVELAAKAASEARASGRRAFVLGEIVHNPRVVARLAALGAERLDGPDGTVPPERLAPGALAGAVVIIRSHGAAPDTMAAIRAAGAELVDATCPKVAANQRAAAAQAAAGRLVVVAGDRGHGETLGVAGHAPGSVVVSTAAEAAAVPTDGPLALVAQTTFSESEYSAIREVLAARSPGLIDSGGICGSSRERRAAVEALATRVEAIVVVGGKNSANTRRLAELAAALGLPTLHVERASEIPPDLGAYAAVGLCAGASTPDEDVREAEERLMGLEGL